jgi:serine/threonine-protein kinase RsbW
MVHVSDSMNDSLNHAASGPQSGPQNGFLTGQIDLTLPSTLATVDRMEQESERFATDHGFNEDDAANIAMAAREAAVNAVMHGNSYSSTKQVRVQLSCDQAALTIRIQDEGAGFNASLLPDPLLPENILRSSGRGIFLMRALMDEVNFRQLNPGTELTMIKHRSAVTEAK